MATTAKHWVVSARGRRVYIQVWNEGVNFGHRGGVFAANGRKIAETRLVPYGFQSVAWELAESLAEGA